MVEIVLYILLVLIAFSVFIRHDRLACRSISLHYPVLRPGPVPPITVIKPVYGANPFTQRNFRSWAEQEYPGPVQLIFSFQTPHDPAIEIAQGIESRHEIELIVNPIAEGYSGKMSNLQNGIAVAKHDLLILSDGDTFAYPGTLKSIAALQMGAGNGIISCLMRHTASMNIWSRIYAAFWNFEHMVFIAPFILSLGRGATGGTMSMTKATLFQLGGLHAFKDCVTEDVAMGRKAYETGIGVSLGPIVDSPVPAMRLGQLLEKFSRAALFGISMNAIGETLQYGLLFCYLILLPAGLLFQHAALIITALVLAVIRLTGASLFWFRFDKKPKLFTEIFISDIIFLFAFLSAMVTRELSWGGSRYRVGKDGKMTRIGDG